MKKILVLFLLLSGCQSFVTIDNGSNSDTQMCNYDLYLEQRPNHYYVGNEHILIYELQRRGVTEEDCINLTGRKGIYSYLEKNTPETIKKKTEDIIELKRKAEEIKKKRKELEREFALIKKKKQANKLFEKLQREELEEKEKIEELEQELALLKRKKNLKFKNSIKNEPISEFPKQPLNINFKSVNKKPDDIAVIIGNANYQKMGKDIPNIIPAYADAEGMKRYFIKALGIKEGNIIYLQDATSAQLRSVFGNKESFKGKLFNWIKPNKSNVYIYYSGHGVPNTKNGNTYLVPIDADIETIEFSGLSLSTFYSNLGKLPVKSITVILESCFSGMSNSGTLFKKASPITIVPKKGFIQKNIKVISAGSLTQMASWEEDNSHSLFTKYFLKAMSGEGDKNNDGQISDKELKNYLDDTMTYYARRYYGRTQTVEIINSR